jgi:flagellar protein FliO/FliZ
VLVAASSYAVTAQAALAADGFKKDETPLPKSVTEGSAGGGIADASSGAGAIARMVVGLAIVLAVVYGVYWLLKKRYRGGSRNGNVADGRLEIVATTPLAGNRAVHLLRAGDELFLVGSSEQSVTGLAAWGPEEAARLEAVLAVPPPVPPQPTQPVGILDALRKLTVRS